MTRTIIVAAAAAGLLGLGTARAAPIVIDFENMAVATQAEGFSAPGAPGVQFFSNLGGANKLQVGGFGNQGIGTRSLLIGNDNDGNFLRMVLASAATSIALDFGNDDPGYTIPGDLAYLAVFSNNVLVGSNTVVMNRDDRMNQTISFSGLAFDTVTFAYTNAVLQPFTGRNLVGLAEIVDNIVIDFAPVAEPVPEPAALALFGMGLLGLGMARRQSL